MEKIKITKSIVEQKKPVDITKLFVEFSMKYRNVFVAKIDEEVFIYRSLGRGEFKEILDDGRFSDLEKEEIICSQCLLYPDPDTYAWDDKNAGIPTELMKAILTDSYLDNVSRRLKLHEYYRSEMNDLDNQITCIIQEAFPMLDLEEIEKWDVDKTAKYLSRAQWKLSRLRGLPLVAPEGEINGHDISGADGLAENQHEEKTPKRQKRKNTVQAEDRAEIKEERKTTIRGGSRENKLTPENIAKKRAPRSAKGTGADNKNASMGRKMSPEQKKAREEFFRKHPEFKTGIIDGFDISHCKSVDFSKPPAMQIG